MTHTRTFLAVSPISNYGRSFISLPQPNSDFDGKLKTGDGKGLCSILCLKALSAADYGTHDLSRLNSFNGCFQKVGVKYRQVR